MSDPKQWKRYNLNYLELLMGELHKFILLLRLGLNN